MKAAELRDLADEELRGKLRELQEELFNLRFQLATGQIENVGRIRTVRRDIARMHTVLRQRQLASQESR
ncbi:MAG: 50S ribosomal protein L29 [Candidatus Tectomicrobia bacterium]|jgi:large subunit ribosomal protein L29|nr:50S ribosomal protein L29 [Candidatus Tectomicrobia bacterium]